MVHGVLTRGSTDFRPGWLSEEEKIDENPRMRVHVIAIQNSKNGFSLLFFLTTDLKSSVATRVYTIWSSTTILPPPKGIESLPSLHGVSFFATNAQAHCASSAHGSCIGGSLICEGFLGRDCFIRGSPAILMLLM